MKHLFIVLLVYFLPLLGDEPSHLVLVTVSPYKYFVEKIAGDRVDVRVMVPAGTSAHTFEPTPKEMIQASRADAWFYLGEAFEEKAMQALIDHHPNIKRIDLKKDVTLIFEGCCHKHRQGADLHIWLSPKEAKIQAKTITDALMGLYPKWKEIFLKRLDAFLKELDQLDQEIKEVLKKSYGKVILVSHPAFAYLCRDYHLVQTSVEVEGKDPTPRQLHTILLAAKKARIRSVFIEPQYSNKGARLIAQEIGASVITLDPYNEDYITTMKTIAKSFADG